MENYKINTFAHKNSERQKAIQALEKAKKTSKSVRRALPSESEFTRGLNKEKPKINKVPDGLLTGHQVAEKIGFKYSTFYSRVNDYGIPYLKLKGKRYYKMEDVEDHIKKFPLQYTKNKFS